MPDESSNTPPFHWMKNIHTSVPDDNVKPQAAGRLPNDGKVIEDARSYQ